MVIRAPFPAADFPSLDPGSHRIRSQPTGDWRRNTQRQHREPLALGTYVTSRVLGLRASALGSYGQAIRSRPLKGEHPRELSASVAASIERMIAGEASRVEEWRSHLYQLLRGNASPASLQHAAHEIAESIQASASALGSAAGGYLAPVSRFKSVRWNEQLAEYGLLASRLITDRELVYAYCSCIISRLHHRDAQEWIGHEVVGAKKRKSKSLVPQGKSVAIDHLCDAGAPSSGLVKVVGVVSGLKVIRDPTPRKFSTVFTLSSLDLRSRVTVRAHMFKLENNGLSNGMVCEVNGRQSSGNSWAQGGLGIDIDRVALGEQSRDSWIDDVTNRMKRFSRRYPDEMNMTFAPFFGISARQ